MMWEGRVEVGGGGKGLGFCLLYIANLYTLLSSQSVCW
jgi:hypothetical protein